MNKETKNLFSTYTLSFWVILFFMILALAGIVFDEPQRVLNQATQICLPCIGIG